MEQSDDCITTVVRIYNDSEKHCRVVEAEYTAEAKYVWQLTEFEKRRVLGGLECVREQDYAVKIKFKEPSVTFNSGREYALSDAEWAIVNRNKIDDPIRIHRFYEDEFDLIMVKLVGEPRLACDMLRKPVQIDNRVPAFLKDWQAMQSWPCYNIDLIGAGIMCSLKPGNVGVRDGQVRLYKTSGRLMYGLIVAWTKKKKLFVPLSRYSHPADEAEMWTERFLYKKEDSMFRAVYLLWNTHIIDIKTAVYSWHAYDVSVKEYELVIQMLNHYYDPLVKLPINASTRVGPSAQSWIDYNRLHPRAMDALLNHRQEATADTNTNFVFTEKSRLINNKEPIVKIRLNQMMNYTEQPELFPEE